MTDDPIERAHIAGARTLATFIGIEGTVWFATKYEIADGCGLFACSDINRHNCPNLRKAEPAIMLRDNDTGSDALTGGKRRAVLEADTSAASFSPTASFCPLAAFFV